MKKILVFTLLLLQVYWLRAQDLPDDLQIGRHTVAEWKYIVDTTWGEGMPTADKLLLFDRLWETADKYYPGFVNNPINWDSVKNHYRPEIEAGVSKGRFAGIINKLGLLLQEGHSGAFNGEVFMTQPGRDIPVVVPTFLFNPDSLCMDDNGWFGAALTPLNDDKLLVIRSVPAHPLGLEAGDIVFGYDGLPWKDIYPLLLAMDFPFTTMLRLPENDQYAYVTDNGSSDLSEHHKWLSCAGLNWHFFDTLDFQKFGSADTLHVATSLLEGKEFFIPGNEQIPLDEIEFPGSVIYEQYEKSGFGPPIIYDTILNNSIGYIYYQHMASNDNKSRLLEAVSALASSDIKGIIFDLRSNMGGYMGWETGFNPIFNKTLDSCFYYSRKAEGDYNDLQASPYAFQQLSEEFLNKPIALLTGPDARSNGDYASYFIHTQPMTRSFGKGSNTAYTIYNTGVNTTTLNSSNNIFWDFGFDDWYFAMAPMNFGRIEDGKLKYFLHNGFDIDEEIWFTQEAAHLQKDNLVERAVDWIKSVAYAEGPGILKSYSEPGQEADPMVVKTGVVNPKSHSLELNARVFKRDGSFIEQINTEENSDGSMPGVTEKEWFGTFSPEPNSYYYAEISTHDLEEDSWLSYPGKLRFTSVRKPEIFPKTIYFPAGSTSRFDLTLTNTSEISLKYPKLKFSCDDPRLDIKKPILSFTTALESDQSAQQMQVVAIDGAVEDSSDIWIQVDIYESTEHYWSDSILLVAMPVGDEEFQFRNELNVYPNPMSEFCRIQISGPAPLEKIELFDLSGRLVFSEYKIGSSSYEIPKGNLVDGIYILKVYADKIYERKLVIQ